MFRAFAWSCVAAVLLFPFGYEEARAATPNDAPTVNVDGNVTPATPDSGEPKTIGIGDTGPAWENLTGTDDKQHSFKDLKDSKAIAIVFTCNTCPVAQAYEDRLSKLSNDYKDKGVTIVAINVNKDPRNNLEAMKQRMEKKGLSYAYLTDPSQQSARSYGATCTPHVFLLDGQRKIVYTGAIDDNMDSDGVAKHYLQDAIDAVLAGKELTTTKTRQFGCGIRYE